MLCTFSGLTLDDRTGIRRYVLFQQFPRVFLWISVESNLTHGKVKFTIIH